MMKPAQIKGRLPAGTALALMCAMVAGCQSGTARTDAPLLAASAYVRVDDKQPEDPAVAAHLAPYAAELDARMNERITVSAAVFEIGQPESPLGNLMADILLRQAAAARGGTVHIAIMNRRGLRIPMPAGEVTVRTMFELMPFENFITLLRFNGTHIRQLADELAVEGGEPVSGLRMVIDGTRATDVTIQGEPLDDAAEYWVATNSWMADGGGELPTLWSPLERVDSPVLLRESFIEYLEQLETIQPMVDGRITEVSHDQ
jgi:2',3'-cyclic-nucleotide 2'-phosphodiesterase (5'-nucleotidase family)